MLIAINGEDLCTTGSSPLLDSSLEGFGGHRHLLCNYDDRDSQSMKVVLTL